MNEEIIGMDLEGSGYGLIEVLSWYLYGETEENHDNNRYLTSVYNSTINVNSNPANIM
jgi:hypothetical protein